ncbi:hypothetical protein QTP70_003630 [Hemibagrus guttatus]|uniref:E3 ubiquitin/ISG15 ligase TRIM25-like n=1 Tax=Hemibagrus guttatus TaxID=175788 RepID=A0AAE0UZ30_9TELE|nr:hypothetical protein QTP70_003630 [Hemibagrus guttatus]
MASISIDFSVDQFSCTVCLDLLKDPVTTPCGHSFCKVCINGCWGQEDVKGVYSCPQCRETFTPRPVLCRNNMLAEVVEKLKKTELQAASPDHCYAGPGDVECDSCTRRKHKAVNSCLVCQASYCEDHLQPHFQSPAFKKHKLVEACAELQEKICSEHDKLMEIYCRTDQSFICYLCTMDQHKGHDIVSTKAERTEKQNELKEEQMKFQQRIQEKQKKVQELKQTVDIIKIGSQAAVDDSERIFTKLISSMEKKRSEVTEMIRAQEKAEVSRAERLLNQLEQEIADLKRRVTELEQLSHTHDHIHFLQSFPSLCVSPGCDDSPSFTLNQHLSFDGVRKSLSDLKKRVEQICEEEFNKIHPQAAAVQMILPSEPKSREDFLQWKGRELADVMERRKVDILCVQETRWKGSKARSIGAGFKLFYYGVDSERNGVGVVLKEEFVRNVLEVKRVSDRVMSLKLEFEGVMLNVVSGYAPQVGCELEEKERFWSELDEVMESIPTGERVVIGANFNGHVGEGNTGDEEVMSKFGVKERNLEGQMVVDFAKRMDMGVVNTYFQKREEHRVTYKSGGRRTQVDYILCRRGNLKEISDCKVVVGESVARQHRMVVCRMTLMVCKTKRSKIEKKTKWWKLKKEECCEEFRQKLRQALGGQVVLPDDWETTAEVIRETGRKVLGVSSGRRKEDKET